MAALRNTTKMGKLSEYSPKKKIIKQRPRPLEQVNQQKEYFLFDSIGASLGM